MIGDGIIDSRDWPAAITIETFHEYLMWSSVVPAVPCTTSVELRQIAAASSSASQLLPVPGSPISSRPRSEASVTMLRSTKLRSPNHFCGDLAVEPVGALGAEDEQAHHLRAEPPGERLRPVVDGLQPVELLGVLDLGGGAQHVGHVWESFYLGEEVLEFEDELLDVAGDHGRAEVLEALAEPRVDALPGRSCSPSRPG